MTQCHMLFVSSHQPLLQTPSATTIARRVGDSPAKVIEIRSKCNRQLAELKNLMESGLLSEEYTSERQAIMDTLHKLKGK